MIESSKAPGVEPSLSSDTAAQGVWGIRRRYRENSEDHDGVTHAILLFVSNEHQHKKAEVPHIAGRRSWRARHETRYFPEAARTTPGALFSFGHKRKTWFLVTRTHFPVGKLCS